MRCAICGRRVIPGGNFCDRHYAAYNNLIRTFKRWKDSMNVSWKEYLRIIKDNPSTGLWAKEVANHLLKKEEN